MDVGRAKDLSARVRCYLHLDALSPTLRRVVVTVVGFTILAIGVALMVLPGPAFLVIPLGLVILGTEFAWARRLVRKAQKLVVQAKDKMTGKTTPTDP